jgi:ABC-type nickel/cobalt efflux system permease component RcnA
MSERAQAKFVRPSAASEVVASEFIVTMADSSSPAKVTRVARQLQRAGAVLRFVGNQEHGWKGVSFKVSARVAAGAGCGGGGLGGRRRAPPAMVPPQPNTPSPGPPRAHTHTHTHTHTHAHTHTHTPKKHHNNHRCPRARLPPPPACWTAYC